MFPDPPKFSVEDMRRCRETGDYKPVMFEWYKFVGSLCFAVAFIQPESPAYRSIPAQHYYILAGLMNRCARLMVSNVALSHGGKFGETTAIVDRCIFESAVKVIYLCRGSPEEFRLYMADGLKTELELKETINTNIARNGGSSLPIEDRMLRSIARHINASGMTEAEIKDAKNIRNLAAMLDAIGIDRLIYVVAQKIGSHHVHGTWPSLIFHYLDKREDSADFMFQPSADHVSTHISQYMFVPMIVLDAMRAFGAHVLEGDEGDALADLFDLTERDIVAVYTEAGEDAR